MNQFVWNEKYSVSIDSIDDQHKKLFAIINRLTESVKSDDSKDAVGELISQLEAYTRVHFSAEEKIMAMHIYPGFIPHKKMHNFFIEELAGIKHSISNGFRPSLAQSLLNFLRDWLIQHILDEDKKIGALAANQ